jgi:hypothetical protein
MSHYKVLGDGGAAIYGKGKWGLPSGKRPGKWMVAKGDLAPCANGLHLCRREDLVHWFGPNIFLAEIGSDEIVESDDKIVVRRARLVRKFATWNECSARLFAADCAEHVLPIFEARYPDDTRPRKAVEAARQFARGEIGAAAGDAAGDAAWAAAGDAAGDAERVWQTNKLFEYLDG